MVRNRLMVEDQHSALELHVRLDGLLVPPHHPQSDRRKPHPIEESPVGRWRRERIAKVIGIGKLTENNYRQKLRYVVHPRVQKVAPGMTVVFKSAGVDLRIGLGGKELVIAVGSQSLPDDFALHRLLDLSLILQGRFHLLSVRGLRHKKAERGQDGKAIDANVASKRTLTPQLSRYGLTNSIGKQWASNSVDIPKLCRHDQCVNRNLLFRRQFA